MTDSSLLVERGLLLPGFYPVPRKTVKVVAHGVICQQFCHDGTPYDVTVSGLQKAIRRGLLDQALYHSMQMFQLGKIFRSHLLNRLVTIASEDIGPAEPSLIIHLADLYLKGRSINTENSTTAPDELKSIITKMVKLLCNAHKSRIADLYVHLYEMGLPSPSENDAILEMINRVYSTSTDTDTDDPYEPIVLRYYDNGEEVVQHKKLKVYGIWQEMLDRQLSDRANHPAYLYSALVALLKIYVHRGYGDGKIHLAHAICLFHIRPEYRVVKVTPSVNKPIPDKMPILDCSIDMHTNWGRKHLGRGILHFLETGAALEHWAPQADEVPIRDTIIEYYRDKAGLDSICQSITPRPYQQKIVNNAAQYFSTGDTSKIGWLIMACGTGKTRTSFWIHQELEKSTLRSSNSLTIIILPYLEILNQFRSVWHDMLDAAYHCGVMASLTNPIPMTDRISYSYIRNQKDWELFASMKRKRILYVTYLSLGKLMEWNPVPDFVICDEAHHHKSSIKFQCDALMLTATPPTVDADKMVGYYHLSDAINDGNLTDYQIQLLDPEEDVIDHMDRVFSEGSKVIVYTRKTSLAKDLCQRVACSNFKCMLVTSDTPKLQRDEIYRVFNEPGTKCAIFNCGILGEGVDLPPCDTIYLHSGYNSPQRVVQAFGRPLRKYKGKDLAKIFIIRNKQHILKLKAMRVYDPEVDSKVIECSD